MRSYLESLEDRTLWSAVLTNPGAPQIADIASSGADSVRWTAATGQHGGRIEYELEYQVSGSTAWHSAGRTTAESMPLCSGADPSILGDMTYVLRVVATDRKGLTSVSPSTTFTTSSALTPSIVQQAYGLSSFYQEGIDGSRETIGLVGLGSDPTLQSDLIAFDNKYNLAPPNLEVVGVDGNQNPVTMGTDHAHEISLDIEWRTPSLPVPRSFWSMLRKAHLDWLQPQCRLPRWRRPRRKRQNWGPMSYP